MAAGSGPRGLTGTARETSEKLAERAAKPRGQTVTQGRDAARERLRRSKRERGRNVGGGKKKKKKRSRAAKLGFLRQQVGKNWKGSRSHPRLRDGRSMGLLHVHRRKKKRRGVLERETARRQAPKGDPEQADG
jgi:hypothetical protein